MNTESLRQQWSHTAVAGHPGYEALLDHAIDLERRLEECRDGFARIARNPGDCCPETGYTSGHIAQVFLARFDADRTLLDDERDVDAFPEAHDDLDEPLPPKQCGLDDPECESRQ